MTAIIAQVVQHTQAHRQSAEGQRRTLWRWVSILPRESCRQFVHKRHNQPLIRQSLAFESPSTFPWIVSICPWNLVKGLRHPQVPPKKTNERQNIRLTRFVFPERDRSASKLLQSWLQSPHLSTNVKAFSVPYIHLRIRYDVKQLSPYNLHWALYKKSNRENSINQGSPCLLSCFEEITMAMKTH